MDTDYVSCYCRGSRCRQVCQLQATSHLPHQAKGRDIYMLDARIERKGRGVSKFWKLVIDRTTRETNKVRK